MKKKAVIIAICCVFFLAITVALSSDWDFNAAPSNTFSAYYNEKVCRFKAENKTAQKGGVVFVGDSLTDSCDLKKYYPDVNSCNRGISGDTVAGVLSRMDVSIFDMKPRVIVILIGINDLNRGFSAEYLVDGYNAILSQIKERLPDAKIILQTLYPMNAKILHSLEPAMDDVCAVNAQIPQIVEKYSGCRIADVYSSLVGADNMLKPEYTTDGLHLSAAGYRTVAAVLLPVINQTLADF